MLMSLNWTKGIEICLQKPSGYLSAQCLFLVLFFQPAVNNFNGFWISPWYTNESPVLILRLTLPISSDAKWKQNSLLCNPELYSPVGLVLTGKERQPQLFLCHQPSGQSSQKSAESQGGDLILETCLQGISSGTPGKEKKTGQRVNCSLPLPQLYIKPLNPCPKGSQGAPARQGASNNVPLVLTGFSKCCSILDYLVNCFVRKNPLLV